MFTKEKSLKIAVVTLTLVAFLDLFRGFMHTFNIWYASQNIAHMTQTPDTMFLMNTFGISNLLTGCIYLLVVKKSKELAPYLLIIIPAAYVIGLISANLTGISQMQVSKWNGQYMMYVYLSVVALVGINYFVASKRNA